MQHFIDIEKLEAPQIRTLLDSAKELKSRLKNNDAHQALDGKQLVMIFEKPSTRTRASFEIGINQLGGQAVVLQSETSQIGRGEPPVDTANVLSRYADLIMIRCFNHDTLEDIAKASTIPVINGLTDRSHPCQVLADILTIEEKLGNIKGKVVAWFGDVNNMTQSWIEAAELLQFTLHIASPKAFQPEQIAKSNYVHWFDNAHHAAQGADVITTDTWFSMGDKDSKEKFEQLKPYQVNQELMNHAKDSAIFLHCLPAHREEEVTSDVIDGKQSCIYDEAENRLHIQKAIMIWCLKNI